jgi:hypothetical protein
MVIDGDGTVNDAEASTDPSNGTSARMLYVPAETSGTTRVTPEKSPEASVVTGAFGSPESSTPLLLLSNQTTPETDAAKPEPETVTVVPGGPLVGLKDIEDTANTGAISNSIGVARSSAATIAAADTPVRDVFPFISLFMARIVGDVYLLAYRF